MSQENLGYLKTNFKTPKIDFKFVCTLRTRTHRKFYFVVGISIGYGTRRYCKYNESLFIFTKLTVINFGYCIQHYRVLTCPSSHAFMKVYVRRWRTADMAPSQQIYCLCQNNLIQYNIDSVFDWKLFVERVIL